MGDDAPADIDEYLDRLPEHERAALLRLREIVARAAPDATERILYKIPAFTLDGDLVGFAAQPRHLSFYVMSPDLVTSMAGDLSRFDVSGATIHFTPDRPIPVKLIERIVRARKKENAATARAVTPGRKTQEKRRTRA